MSCYTSSLSPCKCIEIASFSILREVRQCSAPTPWQYCRRSMRQMAFIYCCSPSPKSLFTSVKRI